MSSQGNGQPVLHKVIISQHHRLLVEQRHLEAIQEGKGTQFLSAFRKIVERLRKDPLVFGEPLYRSTCSPTAGPACNRFASGVDYAVHEERPLVFIRGFKVMS